MIVAPAMTETNNNEAQEKKRTAVDDIKHLPAKKRYLAEYKIKQQLGGLVHKFNSNNLDKNVEGSQSTENQSTSKPDTDSKKTDSSTGDSNVDNLVTDTKATNSADLGTFNLDTQPSDTKPSDTKTTDTKITEIQKTSTNNTDTTNQLNDLDNPKRRHTEISTNLENSSLPDSSATESKSEAKILL